MSASAPGQKLFIIGLDGGTLSLIEPWAAAGKLPNLAKMMEEGVTGELESTIHPLTPQAWASFLSGMNPGKHGIYDFGERVEGSYEITLATSLSRHGAALWDHMESAGKTCGIFNVPLTYPPSRVPGFMVSGMHTSDSSKAFQPPSLHADVKRRFPEYRIDVMSYWYDSYDPFLVDLHEMHRQREALVLDLYQSHKPDLMVAVFISTDRVCHALWGQSALPGMEGSRSGWKYAHDLENIYRAVDASIGKILDAAGDSPVIVMSDHGFGTLEKDVYLNRFLQEAGLLTFHKHRSLWDRIRGRSPRDLTPEERSFQTVDWSRTRAYSHGLFGNVYLNLQGREPEGIVQPGAEEQRVRQKVIDGLHQLRDPDDGLPIVDRVYRKEEIYWGQCLRKAPDLLVRMRDYAYMTRGAAEFSWTDSIVSPPLINHSGNHRLQGIFIARGAPFMAGKRIEGAHIMDVAPTALHLMGMGIPEAMDGKVLDTSLDPAYLAQFPVQVVPEDPASSRARPASEVTASEMKELKENLRGLGYFK